MARQSRVKSSVAEETLFLAAASARGEQPVVGVDPEGFISCWNAAAERLFGVEGRRALGSDLRTLASSLPGTPNGALLRELVEAGTRCRSEGRVRLQSGAGPELEMLDVLDAAGRPMGRSYVLRIADRTRWDQLLHQVQYRVTELLVQGLTTEAALPKILQVLCGSFGWPIGEAWLVDQAHRVLRHAHSWKDPSLRITDFIRAGRSKTFAESAGLPGRVWSTRNPVWIPDVAGDPGFARREEAAHAGIHGAFGFPIWTRSEILGVLAFFDREQRPPEQEFLRTMSSIGAHVGLLFELNQAVGTLAESESRLKMVFETAVDGIAVTDENGVLDSFNPSLTRLFGYAPDELAGMPLDRLIPGLPPGPVPPGPGGRSPGGPPQEPEQEFAGRRKDGSRVPLFVARSALRIGKKHLDALILHDLTEFKTIEDELVRNRSLAAIGETAAAIAHEIKNPLAAISGSLQVLQDSAPPGSVTREIMKSVVGEVTRLDRTVHQLLLLAKPWVPSKQPIDLREIALHVLEMTRHDGHFRGISVDVDGPTDNEPLEVNADRAMTEQVLWNLVLNAAEALRGRGGITLTFSRSATGISLSVADDGPGIPPEVRSKLFRPFFTTKPSGNGLGLATCRKIMDAHNGSLELRDRPAGGTEAILTFPSPGRL